MLVKNEAVAVGESMSVICYGSHSFKDGSAHKNMTCQLVVDRRGNVYPEWEDIGDCTRKLIR